ncbi:YceD family protein [Clostridium ganghwense]|uniref:DUF177 domain-containing protein n=1 Tax=Clostridium ganghwense TaxID=312089 RepID=A0ABT4CTY4_9CLOT|nr:DUF177 domain-containing protein [Clostridium ganghwense]MCY6372378.1 DUF177 domain-containing protein [Clostridium ganghwense]
MIIGISDLIGKKIKEKKINMSFEGENITFEQEEIEFVEPINIEGIFTIAGDIINFDGTIKTTLKLVCSRCLEKFNYPLEIQIHENFSKFEDNKDDEIIIINDDKVDFSPIIETNIILSLPMKRLCSEECLGLCTVCGTNLNHSTCNCEKNDIDPRLAKLRDFFPN